MGNTVSRRFECIITQILHSPKSGQKVRITMTNTTINAGKVNFNVKSAKAFRDTMAIWHIFDFELADLRKKKAQEVANAKGIIATNLELIDKKSFGIHDKAYYEDQIAQMEQNIRESEKRLSDWQAEQEKAVSKVTAIFGKTLYKSYVASMEDDNGAWRVSAYTQAIADLLTAQGLTPAWDTLDTLYHCVRKGKGTGSSKAETGKHNKAMTENMWRTVFMGELCDLMGDILPKYKFIHILTKAEKKALKAQNK